MTPMPSEPDKAKRWQFSLRSIISAHKLVSFWCVGVVIPLIIPIFVLAASFHILADSRVHIVLRVINTSIIVGIGIVILTVTTWMRRLVKREIDEDAERDNSSTF